MKEITRKRWKSEQSFEKDAAESFVLPLIMIYYIFIYSMNIFFTFIVFVLHKISFFKAVLTLLMCFACMRAYQTTFLPHTRMKKKSFRFFISHRQYCPVDTVLSRIPLPNFSRYIGAKNAKNTSGEKTNSIRILSVCLFGRAFFFLLTAITMMVYHFPPVTQHKPTVYMRE